MLELEEVTEKIDWMFTHGVVMRAKLSDESSIMSERRDDKVNMFPLIHAPFSLRPFVVSQNAFEKVVTLAPMFGTLVHKVSLDSNWILSVLENSAKYDEFTGKLVELFKFMLKWDASEYWIPQKICLGMIFIIFIMHM